MIRYTSFILFGLICSWTNLITFAQVTPFHDDDFLYTTYYYYNEQTPMEKPPPCIPNASELVYFNGQFSGAASFLKCISNIPDYSMISTYYNGKYHGQLQIHNSIVLTDLIAIKEVEGTVELTFDILYLWKDDRYQMEGFWNLTKMDFIDITTLATDQNLYMWRPGSIFPNAAQFDVYTQDFRFNANNEFYWQQSIHAVFVQPQFNFADYPADSQTLHIRFGDAEFEQRELIFIPERVLFTTLQNGQDMFITNSVWNYDSNSFAEYEDNVYHNSNVVYSIKVTRIAYGVVIRLVLPLALLILLSSITFWTEYSHRVDVTITILLAMSALYIVILNNIPLVGYLTYVDKFVFWMYFMLVCVCMAHQASATLKEKVKKWPLRAIYLKIIDTLGRTIVVPAVSIYFAEYIPVSSNPKAPDLIIILTSTYSAIIFVKELHGLRAGIYEAMRKLTLKINHPEIKEDEVSTVEAFAMNVFHFKKFTSSKIPLSQYLLKYGAFPVKERKPMELKNLSAFLSMMESDPLAGANGKQHGGGQGRSASSPRIRLSRLFGGGGGGGVKGSNNNNNQVEEMIMNKQQQQQEIQLQNFHVTSAANAAASSEFVLTAVAVPSNYNNQVVTEERKTYYDHSEELQQHQQNAIKNPMQSQQQQTNGSSSSRPSNNHRDYEVDSDDEK